MSGFNDRYGPDVLRSGMHRRASLPKVPADRGLVVEETSTGWVGAVVRVERIGPERMVVLQDRHGRERAFPLGHGFMVDGKNVELTRPQTPPGAAARTPRRTASGSIAVPGAKARTARASRIWVEGRHDAELIEKVWGDDLRIEGIVVEPLGGIDDLTEAIAAFSPGPTRRLGILVDHLVEGSKESRIVARAIAEAGPAGEAVLALGHPFVDVWEAVRPERVGLRAWPRIPKGQDYKRGILTALGWPAASAADVASGWQRILGTVRTIADLDPALSGRVEHLIDFVTQPAEPV